MEKRMRREVPPELIQRIQSRLPVSEATRTCVVSKSWLHSWSTIPTLRFPLLPRLVLQREYHQFITTTLLRYHLNNIAIQSFDLAFNIGNHESASLSDEWIRIISSSTSCLKALFLAIWVGIASYTLPYDIFSIKTLDIIDVVSQTSNSLWISSNVINCVSLRELKLNSVYISEHVLDNLFSTCTLLKKIKLCFCKGYKTIKVKNLPCLYELEIRGDEEEENNLLDIKNVPSLSFFRYSQIFENALPFNPRSLGSVKQLYVTGVIIDDAFLHVIKSNFHFLEDLTLVIGSWWVPESLVITSPLLNRLTLNLQQLDRSIHVEVYAPKLLSFFYHGAQTIPTLLFPTIAPKHIDFTLDLGKPPDLSFFLKMRELLSLSSKFSIHITQFNSDALPPLNTTDVDDLRNRVSFPATNVDQLSFSIFSNASLSLDAFFSICHPTYMKARQNNNNCFSNQMVRRMMEKKTTHLEDVQLLNPLNGNWESLTSSWTSVLDKFPNENAIEFKLNWFSK